MKTNVQSLQDLYVKLGGSLTDTYSDIFGGVPVSDYTIISDMIEACAKKAVPAELPSVDAEDNGKVLGVVNGSWGKTSVPTELPAVTGDDNGDVLTVSEGAWAKTNPPTTGMFIELVMDMDHESISYGKYVCNLTYGEMYRLITSGAFLQFYTIDSSTQVKECYAIHFVWADVAQGHYALRIYRHTGMDEGSIGTVEYHVLDANSMDDDTGDGTNRQMLFNTLH